MHEVHWPVRLANLWGTGPSDKSPLLCDQSTLYTYMIFLNKFTVLKEWQHQKNDAEVDLWSPHQHIPMPLHQYTCVHLHTHKQHTTLPPQHTKDVCIIVFQMDEKKRKWKRIWGYVYFEEIYELPSLSGQVLIHQTMRSIE